MLHDTRTLCAFFNYKGDIKMCGFLVVGSEEFELQVFQKALDKAAYRGPDYQHVSIDHGITWGFNRLSIMDYQQMEINLLFIKIIHLYVMVKYITIQH